MPSFFFAPVADRLFAAHIVVWRKRRGVPGNIRFFRISVWHGAKDEASTVKIFRILKDDESRQL
jgi:hypothetical protein